MFGCVMAVKAGIGMDRWGVVGSGLAVMVSRVPGRNGQLRSG